MSTSVSASRETTEQAKATPGIWAVANATMAKNVKTCCKVLGWASGRYHHDLGRLRTNEISPNPTLSSPGSNRPLVISNWAIGGQNRPIPDCPKNLAHNMSDQYGARCPDLARVL